MAKRKLQRFAENKTFSHFFQPVWEELETGFFLKGRWNQNFFKNNHPLIVEIGCGKGEYTVELAHKYPGNNYIGIDKKGARMWRGAKTSEINEMSNVAFVRLQAENIVSVFSSNEVDEIWITFPEPQPRSPKVKKRFTSPVFLGRFRKILKPGAVIHLKTDNDEFYNYTLEVIRDGGHQLLFQTTDLYSENPVKDILDVTSVKTHYEKIWLEQGLKIKYLKFSLKGNE